MKQRRHVSSLKVIYFSSNDYINKVGFCLSAYNVCEDFQCLLSLDSPEKNCNISCRTKMSSSCIFSLLKLTEVTSNRESLYMKTSSQILDLTSLPSTLTAKKSMKTTFSSGKIYYNFSPKNPKITDI